MFLFIVSIVMLIFTQPISAGGWSGKVVDLRNGKPLANVEVCAGIVGRVDYGECKKTGTDGSFVVNYPPGETPNDTVLYVNPMGSYGHAYLPTKLCGPPNNVLVKLVPAKVFIKGRVVDKITKAPLSGARVYYSSAGEVTTDNTGFFQFEKEGLGVYKLSSSGLFPMGYEGVSQEYICPDAEPEQYETQEFFVSFDDYKRLAVANIPIKSSYDDTIFTYCEVELAPVGSSEDSDYNCRIIENGEVPEEPEVAVVDTDGDGVIDSWDECPNTPSGTPVFSNGCPAEINCVVTFNHNTLTLDIPCLFLNGRIYRVKMKLISINPILFGISSVE